MGRAYRCDLCKQCYPIESNMIGQGYHVSIEDFMKDRSPEATFDICPSCYDEIYRKLISNQMKK